MDLYPEGPSPNLRKSRFSATLKSTTVSPHASGIIGNVQNVICEGDKRKTCLAARGRELNYHGRLRVSIKCAGPLHARGGGGTVQPRPGKRFRS